MAELWRGCRYRSRTGDSALSIVEDEAAIREALTFVLENEGLVVEAVEYGTAGLAAAQVIDFMSIDLLLPDISGTDACRLRDERREVPIILLTARSHDGAAVQARRAGATAFITKPFSMQDLFALLRTLLADD